MQTTDRDGIKWQLWNGGECPVDGTSFVVVINRDGWCSGPVVAKYVHWPSYYTVSQYNVVAYRVTEGTLK